MSFCKDYKFWTTSTLLDFYVQPGRILPAVIFANITVSGSILTASRKKLFFNVKLIMFLRYQLSVLENFLKTHLLFFHNENVCFLSQDKKKNILNSMIFKNKKVIWYEVSLVSVFLILNTKEMSLILFNFFVLFIITSTFKCCLS